MGQATSQIAAHIEDRRAELGSNLRELEHKVKSLTDWESHFQKKPMTVLGIAVGGGILLAAALGGNKRRRRRPHRDISSDRPHSGTGQQAMQAWDNIKGALVGVAASRFKDFVGEIVPGFHEELRQCEQKTTRHSDPTGELDSPPHRA